MREGCLPGSRIHSALPGPCSWLWVDERQDKAEDGDCLGVGPAMGKAGALRDHRTLQCGWCWGDMRKLGLEVRQP